MAFYRLPRRPGGGGFGLGWPAHGEHVQVWVVEAMQVPKTPPAWHQVIVSRDIRQHIFALHYRRRDGRVGPKIRRSGVRRMCSS